MSEALTTSEDPTPAEQWQARIAADPVASLGYWFDLKRRAAELVAEERMIRGLLFAHFFPTPVEGTNNFTLPDGYVLKGKYPIDRKVDPGVVQVLRTLRLRDLEPGMLAQLNMGGADPAMLVTEALRLNLDDLLKWEPDLVTRTYRQLTAEQLMVFDRCLTSKPGSVAMEVAEPPRPRGSKAAPAAGFNGPEAA